MTSVVQHTNKSKLHNTAQILKNFSLYEEMTNIAELLKALRHSVHMFVRLLRMKCSFGHSIKGILNATLELLQINEIFLHCKGNSQLTHIAQHRYSKTLQISNIESFKQSTWQKKFRNLDNKCLLILIK